MVYSTDRAAVDSWRRVLHESIAARPVLYTIGVVGFVPFS
jgi:hypothetical protein